MSQLVIGSALGFLIAQGLLFTFRRAIGGLKHDGLRQRFATLIPARGSSIIGGFIQHAGLIGASVAVIALGAWAARDYLAAKSARSAAIADVLDPSPAVSASDTLGSPDEAAGLARASKAEPPDAVPVNNVDPYADPDFQVHRSHRAGKSVSLKETLVRRSEERARADLLKETQQHLHRSQYDCEAADRASRYVKGGLDVWGFATWQIKYFPVNSYTGATLAQCQAIKNVVDPSWMDLHSTVVQRDSSVTHGVPQIAAGARGP
jgi:hypothetical protein